MAERSPFVKAGFPHARKRLSDLPNGCFLLFLNGFSNDEQELAILACSSDNYRRFPVERILTVLLTIWFTPILRREGEKNFLSIEVR